MTEDEAKKKWCPFARSLQSDGDNLASANRGFDSIVDVGSMCIASECMAWRHYYTVDPFGIIEPIKLHEGYCGLVGKP